MKKKNEAKTFNKMDNLSDEKFIKAKQRIEELKEFYKNVVAYILVNLFLTFVWKFSFTIFGNFVISNRFNDDGFKHIPIWLIWGVFLAVHAIKVFGSSHFYSKDWEQRKIDEFMKKQD